jgi:predicted transglutaminase-like cysteine proteinase
VYSHALQAAEQDRSAAAREVATTHATEQNRNPVRVALLTPEHSLRSAETYVRENEHLTSDVAAKWRDVLARIESDQETLAACRTSPDVCSEAARRLLDIVELGRERAGRARLAEINRVVNLTIKAISDRTQYGVDDFWSSPLSTLEKGGGDCEDYAILKYLALREAGISPDDLRLLIVSYPRHKSTHVVLAARLDGEWLLLDNLTTVLVNSLEATHYRPLAALDQHGIAALATRSAVAGVSSLLR